MINIRYVFACQIYNMYICINKNAIRHLTSLWHKKNKMREHNTVEQ